LTGGQNASWYTSIIEAISYLLTFITTIFMVRRASTKKKMAKIQESLSMGSGYNQVLEMGTMQSIGTGKGYMPVTKVESADV
jgi:hypothetical protein